MREAEAANVEMQVEHKTTKTTAPANIAERLGINEGDPVTCTRYIIRMGNPWQPVTSSLAWEPLAVTGGTDIELPHEGSRADKGIVGRFSTIGHEVNQYEERLDIARRLQRRRSSWTSRRIAQLYRSRRRSVALIALVWKTILPLRLRIPFSRQARYELRFVMEIS
ncbi:hypothetical protein M8542_36755 [Amycolatopsis sp. OK19-0408]|uniref:UTRA domain-containing protein n=1 Tax=Amycolatopsis iheyensis TaxID=2945988 RepID=A0A9X2SPP8_9PSEU|nr:hypothetical protein [Amycolatopsis iheyensis]MCR6488396.1 hypothetical protein [Amycolatopsis iheyensis]